MSTPRDPARTRAKRSASMKKRWADPDYAQRVTEGIKRAWDDPLAYTLRVAVIREALRRPERRAIASIRSKEMWARPGKRAALLAALKAGRAPDYRERQIERMKAQWQDPAYRARVKAAVKAAHARKRALTGKLPREPQAPNWVPAALAPIYEALATRKSDFEATRLVRDAKRALGL